MNAKISQLYSLWKFSLCFHKYKFVLVIDIIVLVWWLGGEKEKCLTAGTTYVFHSGPCLSKLFNFPFPLEKMRRKNEISNIDRFKKPVSFVCI